VIILLLYVYYSALIMLVGAEMNQVIEWHIPGGKNEGEKIPADDRNPDVHRLNREDGQDGEGR
jgi:membrane protein